MKSWDEVRNEMVVYIKDPIEIYEDDVIIGKTKPFQRAYVEHRYSDEITIIIYNGEFEGYDLSWHMKTDYKTS